MPRNDWESGWSPTTKVIVAFSVAGVFGLILCCGGAIWIVNRAVDATQEIVAGIADAMTQNPAEIRALTASMVTIEIPEGWQPVTGMEWSIGTEMTTVMYSPNQMQSNRILTLMQMRGAGINQQQMEQQLQMQQAQMNQPGMNPAYGVQSSTTRTFVIDGEDREFLFSVVNDGAGGTMHQVQGAFPGRNGTVMFQLMEDDANWDEEVVVRMIESITAQ